MKNFYKGLRRILAVLLGIVFFAAGTLKLMDPVGTGLLAGEYLRLFGMGGFSGAAGFLGLAASLLETITGAALITGVWRRIVAWVCAGQLFIYTIITLILLILNPPMDCGCFGEMIKLTHAQSFVKNLVLCGMWIISFVPMKLLDRPKKIKYLPFGLVTLSSVAFMIFSLAGIPLVSFTPFKPGTQIGYDTKFDEVPLSIRDSRGNYADDTLHSGKKIIYSLFDPSPRIAGKCLGDFDITRKAGFEPLLLLSQNTGVEKIDSLAFFADRKDLLSLNRSNGGGTWLSDGMLVSSWPFSDRPSERELSEMAAADPLEEMLDFSASGRLRFEAYLLVTLAIMFLL
ncbi:MAG: DoxX family protein [Bacteroidales bacterium]|nr:DoxX family protein [Bacteroidales bacterium]